MGRFLSPDPSDGPDAVPFSDLENPQSLNLYSYVYNNPLSSVDDDGHDGAAPDQTCGFLCWLGKLFHGGGGDGGGSTQLPPGGASLAPPGAPEGAPGTTTGPLIAAQDAARANPNFQPIPGGSTFCNVASCYIGRNTGSNMGPLLNSTGQPNLANTDAQTLAHSGAYHRVGPAEAQRLANLGKAVYGVMAETGHGHIITVRPNNGPYTGSAYPSSGPNDPIINDIGRNVGVYPLSQQRSSAFQRGVIFYAPNQ